MNRSIVGRSARWARGMVVTATAAGLLVTGAGIAAADSDGGTTATTGSNQVSSNSQSPICTKRIPAVLGRIDSLTERINGSAGTRGSTAWLQAKAQQARQSGFTALADLLDARAAARPQRLDELAALRKDVQDVQSKDCA